MSRGTFSYDYCDTGRICPLAKMYTLGHDYIPASSHAGGLRYHGMNPILSELCNEGLIEAVSVKQTEVFEAAEFFARTEGTLPAPESSHAIKAAIDEAIKCRETGEEKTVTICNRFRYVNRWFSLDQTSGKDYQVSKDFENLKIGDFDFSKLYKEYNIKMISYDSLNGNSQGYVNINNEIALNPLVAHAEKTILHEICHVALGHTTDRKDLERDLKEVEAETTCFIVGTILKFSEDDLSSCRAYIQGWLNGNDLPEKNIKKILATANKILEIGLGKKDKPGE